MEGQHRGPRTYVAVDVVEENQKLLQCSHDNYAASQLPTAFPWAAEAGTVAGTAPIMAQACAAQAPAPAPPPGPYARNCNYISENHHLQRKTSTQQETLFFHPIAGPPPAPYYTYNYQFVGGHHQLPHFVGMASAAAAAAPHQHHQLQESLHAQAAAEADPPPHHRRGQQQQHQQQIGVAKAKAKEQPLVLHDKDKRNRRRGHRTLLSSHLYETCGNNQIQQIPGQHLVHDDAAIECDEYRHSLELLDEDDHYASTLKMDPDEDLVLRTYNARIDDDSPEAVACCSVLPGMLTKTVVAGGESGSAQDTGRNFCLGAAAGSGSSCQGATGAHGNGVGPLAAGVGVRSGCPDCEEKFGTSTSTGSRDHPTAGPPPMSTTTTKEDEVEAKGSAGGASLKREDEQADAPSSPGETSTACPQSPDVAGGLVPGSVGTTGRRVNVHKQLAPHQAAASSTSSSIGIGVDKEQTFPSSTSTAQTHQEKDETNQLRYQDGGDVEVEVALAAVTNGDGYAIVPTPAYCEDGGIAVAYDTSCPSVLAAATQAGGEQVEPGGGSYTAYNEQPMDVPYGCATTTSDLDGRIVGILEMTTEKKNLLRTGYDKIQHVANQCLSLTYRQLVESEPAAPKGTATVVPYGSVITGCLLEDGSDLDVGVILRGVDCHSDSSCQSQSESDVLFLSRMLPLLADIGFQKLELVANAKVPVLRGELVVGDQLQNTHSSYDQHHHYHQLRAEFDISLHKDDYVFHNSLLLRDWLRGGDGTNLHHHGHPQTACLRIWTREFPTPGGAATSRAGETTESGEENMRRRTSAAPQFPFPGSAQQALELDRTFLPYRFSLVLKQWGKFVTLNPNRPDAPAFIRRSRCNSYATTAPSARTSRVVDHDREGGSRTHGVGGDQPLQRQPRSVEEEHRAAWPPLASTSAGGPPVGPPFPRGSWCGAGAGNRAGVVEYGAQSQGGRGQAPRPSSQSHVPPPPPPRHQPFSAAQQSGGSSNLFSNQRAPFLQFRPTQHRPLYLNNYCLLLMMFYYLKRRAEYFWTTFHAAAFPGPNWDLPAVFLDFGRFWLYEFQPEREVVDIFTGTPADVNRAAAPTHLHLVIQDPVRRHLFRGLSREQYALFLDRLHEARCVATHPPCPHYGLALCVGVAGKWMSR